MVKIIRAQINNARWDASYAAHEAAYDFEWDGYSRADAARKATWVYYRTLFACLLLDLRYALGSLVCKVRGHDVEHEEQIHGERSADGKRWVDIDGCYVAWHCRRCNRAGGGWM